MKSKNQCKPRKRVTKQFLLLLVLIPFITLSSYAQINSGGSHSTANHSKQIIGYVPNWDAWKDTNLHVPKASLNHYNIDYSQYTILNFSFFGVAVDGSLHSGDLRNKQIYASGQVQQPAALLHPDEFSSHDQTFILGQPKTFWGWDEKLRALGYEPHPDGGWKGWIKTASGQQGNWPLVEYVEESMIKIAQANGVKVMASIGGWSMCKHFPEMAADPVKRARFIADCVTLVNQYKFDGIDLDWEYPGPFSGMNFTGTTADYHNFTILVSEIRQAIGPNKLITAAMSASPNKLDGIEWSAIDQYMDYYNMMTYDFNGGWSGIAGHNSPLYDYPGAEYANFSLDATYKKLAALNVNLAKVNLGVAFYGRAVNTSVAPVLGAQTLKTQVNFSVDGPVQSAADMTRFAAMEGTPYYTHLLHEIQSGQWNEHWDDVAKVPYLTHKTAKSFISYDNPKSIQLKAQYIKDKNLAGCIVWEVFSDWVVGPETKKIGRYPYCPTTKSPLVNVINQTFAGSVNNTAPQLAIVAPTNLQVFTQQTLANINLSATATDSNGTIASVVFEIEGQSLTGQNTGNNYSVSFLPTAYKSYSLTVRATDNQGAVTTKNVSFTVESQGSNQGHPLISENMWNTLFPYRYGAVNNGTEWVLDPANDFFTYQSFLEALNRMSNIKAVLKRRCGTNAYVVTRINKTTGESVEIRHDSDFDAPMHANKAIITKEVDYGTFLEEGTLEERKRELSAFLANIAHETTGGWPTAPGGQFSWGLHFREEVGSPAGYRDETNVNYPPAPGKSYHGRGPIQLSWNYNYGQVSEYLYGDKSVLLNEPEKLVQDAALAFQTAIWFWMTPQYPKPSAHDVMASNWQPNPLDVTKNRIHGLGMTVNVINGGLECGQGVEKSQVLDRIGYYQRFSGVFTIGTDMDGVHDLSDCGCKDMSSYGGDSNDLTAEACAQQPSIAFSAPTNNQIIQQATLAPVAVTLTVDPKNTTLTQISTSVNNQTFTGTSFNWTPSAYGNYTLLATATFANGQTATATVKVTIWDGGSLSCDAIPAWNSASIYAQTNTFVTYQNVLYKNKWWTQNETPGSNAVWEFVRSCNGSNDGLHCGQSAWLSSKTYNSGDKAFHNQKIYKAKWWTQNETPGTNAVWEFESNCASLTSKNQSYTLVYPTHVNEEITFELEVAKTGMIKIQLLDLTGNSVKEVYNQNTKSGKHIVVKNVSDLRKGIYIYKIFTENDVQTGKIIKN
jgi:chitinase